MINGLTGSHGAQKMWYANCPWGGSQKLGIREGILELKALR